MKLRNIATALAFSLALSCAAQTNPPRHQKPREQERDEPSMVPGSITQAQLKAMREQEVAAQKIIVAKEQALYEAEKRKDVATIMAAMSDDFIEIGPDGAIYHKSQIATMLPEVETTSFSMSEIQLKLLTPDTALIIYHYDVDSKYKGERQPQHWRSTSIWTRKKGDWQVRFHQSVPSTVSAAQ